MSSASERVAEALGLEQLKRIKTLEQINTDFALEAERIVADQRDRGRLVSGITGTRLAKADVARAERIIYNALDLRRESIRLVPEMASEEHCARLLYELENSAESLSRSMPERIAAHMGGRAQMEGMSPLPASVERDLKLLIRREMDIMKQEHNLSSMDPTPPVGRQRPSDHRRVFVVHGRNIQARDAMFSFLRSLDLAPIEWSEAVSFTGEGSPFNGQVLEKAFTEAAAVVVLITGDDLARLGTRFQGPHEPPTRRNSRHSLAQTCCSRRAWPLVAIPKERS